MISDLMDAPVRPDEPLRPGTERFGLRILARLAGGETRGVELGADPVRGDLAAVKHATVGDPLDGDAVTRLEREHAMLRSLDHPTIRGSLGLRRERAGMRTRASGLLLRFVDGSPLDRWEASDLPAICRVMSEVCRGLSHVHERGLVHGDLRPRHILVDDRDRPVIVSFGRAVRSGHRFESGTLDHAYAAPERLDGGIATPRADVYGVAATIAAVLLRHAPSPARPGDSTEARRSAHDRLDAVLAERGIHPPLHRLLIKALDPDPIRRPAFIESLGSRLGDLADTLSRRRFAA